MQRRCKILYYRMNRGLKSLLPHVSDDCLQLILAMLVYDPDDRINSKDVMKHAFFKEMVANEHAPSHAKITSSSSKDTVSHDSKSEVG